MQLPKTLPRFIWRYLKNRKITLSLFLIIGVIWSLDLSLSPYFLKMMIDGVSRHQHEARLLLASILIPAVAYGSMSLIMNITFRVYDYLCLRFFPDLKVDVALDLFRHLSEHSYHYFQERFSGTLTKKIMDMCECVDSLVKIPTETFIPRFISVVIAALMLLLVKPIFSLLLVTWVLLFAIAVYFLSKKANHYASLFSENMSVFSGRIVDSISNIITVKIFGRTKHEYKRLDTSLETLKSSDRKMSAYMLMINLLQGLAVTLLVSALLYLLISGAMNNSITPGDFAFVLTIAMFITMNIWDLGQQMVNFTKFIGRSKQSLSLLVGQHDIIDAANATPLKLKQGEITFKDVDFCYKEPIGLFQDLNVTIQPGQRVGLVGESGGGKSSFLKLILRLYDVQQGDILIDSQNIKSVTLQSLVEHIAFIPQEPELFHRSIAENIAYGKLDATKEEIMIAAKKAHCDEFIEKLPQQYDTLVGERGIKLSGGQRQRIAIARAILKNAPILLLDEATSALDSSTERFIQASLHQMMQSKTTIVIAHRLSTLLEMDRILFFRNGEIIEDGSFDDLLKANGEFAHLWKMQSGGFIP